MHRLVRRGSTLRCIERVDGRETNRERERERISASDPLVHIARNREKWEPRGRRERRGRRRTTLTIARERSSTRRECIQGPRTRAEGVNALVQRGRVRVPRTPAKILVRGCVDVLIIAVSRVPRRERACTLLSSRVHRRESIPGSEYTIGPKHSRWG